MKDLIRLYNIESHNPNEESIHKWICHWLDEHNVDYEKDGLNIFRLTGKDIVLSAHMDQVETNGQAVHFYQEKTKIIGYNKDYEQTSLGADDKNGIWIILKALEHNKDTNFIISVGEEVGCKGMDELEKDKVLDRIKEDSICLVLDRKGFGEVLDRGSTGPYCNTLAQVLCNFWNQYYQEEVFKVSSGTLSDTSRLCKHCESVNVSVGYYKAHSEYEYTDYDELVSTKDMVIEALNNFVYYPCPVKTYYRESYYAKHEDYNDYDGERQGSLYRYW